MDKFKEIRPVVLGVAVRNNRLLVGEGFDRLKNQTFYRCLGGGIDFLERSSDALRIEFFEEIGVKIVVKDFLGVSENIFNYNGRDAHELILFYSVDVPDDGFKEVYVVEDDGGEYVARWVDVGDFKSGEKVLYPEEVFRYI